VPYAFAAILLHSALQAIYDWLFSLPSQGRRPSLQMSYIEVGHNSASPLLPASSQSFSYFRAYPCLRVYLQPCCLQVDDEGALPPRVLRSRHIKEAKALAGGVSACSECTMLGNVAISAACGGPHVASRAFLCHAGFKAGISTQLTSLEALHAWLNTRHSAYAFTGFAAKKALNASSPLAQTY
jgi:hypothetical protein